VQVIVNIPIKAQILAGGVIVRTAVGGTQWLKSQLGGYADKSGVYVLHSDWRILYVGKTTEGDYGNFGERLRRHFHDTASQTSKVHQLLIQQTGEIRAYLLDLEDLDLMIDHASASLTRERKALVMEQLLIGLYDLPGNSV
jgi:hypothetical protein